MGAVTIGVDIGQKIDPTALAVAEYEPTRDTWIVRRVERLPLGTKYPAVAQRIVEVVGRLHEREPWLLLDATGVGLPVVDLVRAALEEERISCRVTACWFTHGDRCEWGMGEARVGKAYVVSRLQALLQQDRIKWPRTAETTYLADELLAYEIRVDDQANDRYGAFRVGTHDDVVTAVGLSVLPGLGGQRVAFASAHTHSIRARSIADVIWAQAEERIGREEARARGEVVPEPEPPAAPKSAEEAAREHQEALAKILRQLGSGLPGGW